MVGPGEVDPQEVRRRKPSVVADLCRAHVDWAVDLTEDPQVPPGWEGLLGTTFESLAAAVADGPPLRLAFRTVVEHRGSLFIDVAPLEPSSGSDPRLETIRRILGRTRSSSTSTCRTCGGPAHRRRVGFEWTLCDRHADACEQPPTPAFPRRDGTPFALYAIDQVAAVVRQGGPEERDDMDPKDETGHQARLRELISAGEGGRWRTLARPDETMVEDLDGLDRRAPHMGEVTDLVRRHLRAALVMDRHTWLPPLLLVGEPGIGKTWYLSRLAGLLGVPFRHHPMNLSSIGEGLSGAHASWRNAQPGLVARTLLGEPVANPLILVDEVDKPAAAWREDPYRAFYSLLEPEGARTFVDEYLQFPLDASAVIWVFAANSTEILPEPIVDRLTIIDVPAMVEDQLRAVVASVYGEANSARDDFFERDIPEEAVLRLLDANVRGIRRAIVEAMVRAAADGRRAIRGDDVAAPSRPASRRIGFVRDQRG